MEDVAVKMKISTEGMEYLNIKLQIRMLKKLELQMLAKREADIKTKIIR